MANVSARPRCLDNVNLGFISAQTSCAAAIELSYGGFFERRLS